MLDKHLNLIERRILKGETIPHEEKVRSLLEPFVAGDPCSPLRWTCKSVSSLTEELIKLGHQTSTRMVHELLVEMRYTMQGNKKTKESGSHPDRNEQFLFINEKVKHF